MTGLEMQLSNGVYIKLYIPDNISAKDLKRVTDVLDFILEKKQKEILGI